MVWLWDSLLEWLRSFFFKREMELALIGLNRAGKSTLVDTLSGRPFQETYTLTTGFSMRKVTKGSVTIKIWDLGGQPRFRGMWERYCRGVQAIVYVVDSADHDTIEQATKLLHELMQRPSCQGVPLLVLGNKNDLPLAVSAEDLSDRMRLAEITSSEVGVYSISCKSQHNIDKTLEWLTKR